MSAIQKANVKNHILFWSFAFILLCVCVWIFKTSLMPFVLGAAIAYLLDPVVDYCEKYKCPRWLSAASILFIFFAVLLGLLAIILPFLHREIIQLTKDLPGYTDKIWTASEPLREWLRQYIGDEELESFRSSLNSNAGKLAGIGGALAGAVANSGQALFSFISVLFITPLVAFFMMKDWTVITEWIDDLIPRENYKVIKDLLEKINGKVSGFIRGQFTIAIVLAIIYAAALTIAGLNYGFIIGFSAGMLSIIPLLGSTFGLIASVGVAWFQNYDWVYTLIIAAIFFTGQIIEGNVLTPKLLGKSVGLHPLWILFSLMVGGSMFGIVGMLLAVPVTASIGVLTSFGINQYKDSDYYKEKSIAKKTGKKTASKQKSATKKTTKTDAAKGSK